MYSTHDNTIWPPRSMAEPFGGLSSFAVPANDFLHLSLPAESNHGGIKHGGVEHSSIKILATPNTFDIRE